MALQLLHDYGTVTQNQNPALSPVTFPLSPGVPAGSLLTLQFAWTKGSAALRSVEVWEATSGLTFAGSWAQYSGQNFYHATYYAWVTQALPDATPLYIRIKDTLGGISAVTASVATFSGAIAFLGAGGAGGDGAVTSGTLWAPTGVSAGTQYLAVGAVAASGLLTSHTIVTSGWSALTSGAANYTYKNSLFPLYQMGVGTGSQPAGTGNLNRATLWTSQTFAFIGGEAQAVTESASGSESVLIDKGLFLEDSGVGEETVLIDKDLFVEETGSGDDGSAGEATQTVLATDTATGSETALLEPFPGLRIQVLDLVTSLPVSGATVRIECSGNTTATTDASGYVTFEHLTVGFHTWSVGLSGYFVVWDGLMVYGTETGWIDHITYLEPEFGALACEALYFPEASPWPTIRCLELVADADGVVPLGTDTLDHTPTFEWEVLNGTPPLSYRWELYGAVASVLTLLTSGTTSGTTVTLPSQVHGEYHFHLLGSDSAGRCTRWHSYDFQILTDPFPGEWGVGTEVIGLSAVLTAEDSGVGTEEWSRYLDDSGSGAESLVHTDATTPGEGGTGTESWTLTVATSGTESATGSEGITVNQSATLYNLRLIPDVDGYPVLSGQRTYDRTPTFTWAASGGTLSQSGFQYRWQLYQASTFVTSGVTQQDTVQLPLLEYQTYRFQVQGLDRVGTPTAWTSGAVTVLFLSGSVESQVPPDADLRLLVSSPDPQLRYLPQWLSCYGTATAPPSGSLLYRFFRPTLGELDALYARFQDLPTAGALLELPVSLPRQAWLLQTAFTATQPVTVTLAASGVTRTVTRVASAYDFLTAREPVCLLDPDGQLLLRNLALREVEVTPVSGLYYLPDEGLGIVGDAEVVVFSGATGYVLAAGSVGIDPDRAVVQLPASLSGTLTFQYQSRTVASALQLSVSGQPYQVPDAVDLWNRFDELGLLAGYHSPGRRTGEDNRRFRDRIYSRFLSRRGDDAGAVLDHLGQEFSLTRTLAWNGRTPLTFADYALYGVTRVEVRELPRWGRQFEQLLPTGTSGEFSASKTDWVAGWQLWVEGLPAGPESYPDLTQDGAYLDFGTGVSGTVTAHFRFPHYELEADAQGYWTTLTPVLTNLASGSYQVLVTRRIQTHVLDDPEYQAAALLEPSGVANGFYRDLRTTLLQDSPLYYSRARWVTQAQWLSRQEELPQLGYLPAVFDLGT